MEIELALLAAGSANRFGAIKQLADVNGKALIRQVIDNIPSAYFSRIMVLLGANHERIQAVLPAAVEQRFVEQWQQGMSASIKAAVANSASSTTHLMVVLGDQIALSAQDYDSLMRASGQYPEHVVCAHYQERFAVPAIFPRAYWQQLSELSGDKGARQLLANTDQIVTLDMPRAAIDIDTPEQLRAYLSQ